MTFQISVESEGFVFEQESVAAKGPDAGPLPTTQLGVLPPAELQTQPADNGALLPARGSSDSGVLGALGRRGEGKKYREGAGLAAHCLLLGFSKTWRWTMSSQNPAHLHSPKDRQGPRTEQLPFRLLLLNLRQERPGQHRAHLPDLIASLPLRPSQNYQHQRSWCLPLVYMFWVLC